MFVARSNEIFQKQGGGAKSPHAYSPVTLRMILYRQRSYGQLQPTAAESEFCNWFYWDYHGQKKTLIEREGSRIGDRLRIMHRAEVQGAGREVKI